jgi:hypothetical protein
MALLMVARTGVSTAEHWVVRLDTPKAANWVGPRAFALALTWAAPTERWWVSKTAVRWGAQWDADWAAKSAASSGTLLAVHSAAQ